MSNFKPLYPFSKTRLWTCSFYSYQLLKKDSLDDISKTLSREGRNLKIRGLILLSTEGLNISLTCQLKSSIQRYLNLITKLTSAPITPRWQTTKLWGFKSLRIKIKDEIVQSWKKELNPADEQTHLTPKKWQQYIREKNPTILDIRNDYEVQVGHFKQAQDLKLKKFKDFPKKLKKSKLPKDKTTLIYCTGGVRCEKALSEMKNQGFKKVYLLKGGIINYLKEFPNSYFDGECFVFDHRSCIDQNLNPSKKYSMCPHCGQPGSRKISCVHCQDLSVVCQNCYDQSLSRRTCSKNCAYHYEQGHRCNKRASQVAREGFEPPTHGL